MIFHTLIFVEGSHDVALLSKLFQIRGFTVLKQQNELSKLMQTFLPHSFPFRKDSLQIFNFIPEFLKKEEKHIAIFNCNGEKNLLKKMDDIIAQHTLEELEQINLFVLFADADDHNREDKLGSIFSEQNLNVMHNIDVGLPIINHKMKVHILNKIEKELVCYIFPNNQDQGTIESLLYDTIEQKYPGVYDQTRNLHFQLNEVFDAKQYDINKSVIGHITNCFYPGAPNTALIHDEKHRIKLFTEQTISKSVMLTSLLDFLDQEIINYNRSYLQESLASCV